MKKPIKPNSLHTIDKDNIKKVISSLKKENSNANFNAIFIFFFCLFVYVIFRVLRIKHYI